MSASYDEGTSKNQGEHQFLSLVKNSFKRDNFKLIQNIKMLMQKIIDFKL